MQTIRIVLTAGSPPASLTTHAKVTRSAFRVESVYGALRLADAQSPGDVTVNGATAPLPDCRLAEHADLAVYLTKKYGVRFEFNDASNRFRVRNTSTSDLVLQSVPLGWTDEVTVAPAALGEAPSQPQLNQLTALLVRSSCGASIEQDAGRLVHSDLVAVVPVSRDARLTGYLHWEGCSHAVHTLRGEECERLGALDIRLYDQNAMPLALTGELRVSFDARLELSDP